MILKRLRVEILALLDTCILVDFIRRRSEAISFVESLKKKPAISVVSIAELYAGAKSQREETVIETILADTSIKDIDMSIARRAGIFLKHYLASHNTGHMDALIAATAEHYELELITLNIKHFPMFPDLKRPYE